MVSRPFAHIFNCANAITAVIEYYTRTQGWTEEEVRQQIITVYSDDEVSSFSALDLTSIMMYVIKLYCPFAAHVGA